MNDPVLRDQDNKWQIFEYAREIYAIHRAFAPLRPEDCQTPLRRQYVDRLKELAVKAKNIGAHIAGVDGPLISTIPVISLVADDKSLEAIDYEIGRARAEMIFNEIAGR